MLIDYHCPSWCSFKSFTTRGPQPLPPHAPVPALVRSLILGNVSQPSKIASLIAFLVILRQVQTFVNLSKMAVGI